MKIVVFDLDETLGYFVEFSIFLDCISNYLKRTNNEYQITQTDFNQILDLYPEFIRPNIVQILSYLKNKKQMRDCKKLMIYTNNQGPRTWANQIISFFESKIEYKLIDQIIGAFKINGKRVELCRTSHDKSHNDLIRCTKIPRNTEICFIDDVYHQEMVNKNIYYINRTYMIWTSML
jgi:FMN phosphatase YigB (HAD superfamily)